MTKATWDRLAGQKKAPSPKHIRIAPEQTVHLHVTEDGAGEGRELGAYTLTADKDGVVQMVVAPGPAEPVQAPDPVSGR